MSTRRLLLCLIFVVSLPTGAQDIAPFQAQAVKPYQAQDIKPYQPGAVEQEPRREEARPPARSEAPASTQVSANVRGLLGAWQSGVSGAVWTSPSSIPGWENLHISPGAMAGLLVIYPNGTYVWNSYGGKKGRWSTSNDTDYPIVLDDRVENKKWQVGFDRASPGRIWIYDGNSISYSAKRPARK
ncbi:hypothetical protein [Pseudoduganella sp. GCM10020061]|uniref:hypothetical protein n=1 Tax=Pseudoduganella sp. GCM10020061 TaxID=3317345 RepID=UPI003634EED8